MTIKYAPVNPADTYTIKLGGVYGDQQTAPPFICGHDCVGIVTKVSLLVLPPFFSCNMKGLYLPCRWADFFKSELELPNSRLVWEAFAYFYIEHIGRVSQAS